MQPSSPMLPQQSLSQAIDLEDHHISRYRAWALRLRPFDPDLALILDMQAREMNDHKGALLRHAGNRPGHRASPRNADLNKDPAGSEHFFVLDAHVAAAILEKALALKEQARHCYQQCLLSEPQGSQLGGLYQNLCSFTETHIQILLDAQECFESKRRPRPFLSGARLTGQRYAGSVQKPRHSANAPLTIGGR